MSNRLQRRHGSHSIRQKLLALAILVAASLLLLPAIGQFLVVADPLAPADAVVPLAGGEERARYAAALVRQGYASRFVASDLTLIGPTRLPESGLNALIAAQAGILGQQIYTTDRIVTSTYQELQAIYDLAQSQGWRSLILVTSPEHTRRTQIIAHIVFQGTGIAISIRPVVGYGSGNPARWWQNAKQRRLTLMEYAKIGAFLVGYHGR